MKRTYREHILDFASQKESFNCDELFSWLQSIGMDSRNSMAVTLSRMMRKGEIVRIAQGRYAKIRLYRIFA